MSTRQEFDQIADDACDKGHFAFCREFCEKLLAQDPDDGYFLGTYADQLIKFSLYSDAERVIEHAEQIARPGSLKWILSRKGRLYRQMGDFQKAESIFMQAHALAPWEPALLVFAGAVAFNAGAIQRAIELTTQATLCSKPFEEAHYNLGGYFSALKRYEEARACYKRALDIDPEYELALNRLADTERVLDFYAIQRSEKALRLYTDSPLRESDQILEEALDHGHFAFCREFCEQLLTQYPDDDRFLSNYADQLINFSLYSEAERVIEHAEKIARPVSLKWILSQKGRLYRERGEFQKAESLFMQAHALAPSEPALLVFAGAVAFDSGAIQRAIELTTQATLCEKPFEEAHYNLGGSFSALKRYEEARECYKRALEIDPEYELALNRLADTERVLDFYAIQRSEKALRLHIDS